MIDLHTHTFASDGELGPAELVRRASVAGYRALAITDHADQSNVVSQLRQLRPVVDELGDANGLCLLAGVELTHVPPKQIAAVVALARANQAQLVLVHGETIVEPVIAGTNRAAIEAGVDILAHPGLISAEDVQLAVERGVFLEITTRKGHSLTNGHVAKMAQKFRARLVINNDAHAPGDLVSLEMARKIARGAGLTEAQFEAACQNSLELVERSRNADK
jgi:histidinol phosphatase-like PHP family hydrolase